MYVTQTFFHKFWLVLCFYCGWWDVNILWMFEHRKNDVYVTNIVTLTNCKKGW